MFGDRKPYPVALLTLDAEAVRAVGRGATAYPPDLGGAGRATTSASR